jgi:transcriptional regulator
MGKPHDSLIPGTLSVLILKSLTRGSLHGYAISKWLQQTSEDVLRVEEGVLYPALHKLEKEKWLRAEWGVNDTGRRAKFYSLTPLGKRKLQAEVARWKRSSQAVSTVLDVEEA